MEAREKPLKECKTCEIVEELKEREGITAHWAEPHENKEFSVAGPTLVLIVID